MSCPDVSTCEHAGCAEGLGCDNIQKAERDANAEILERIDQAISALDRNPERLDRAEKILKEFTN